MLGFPLNALHSFIPPALTTNLGLVVLARDRPDKQPTLNHWQWTTACRTILGVRVFSGLRHCTYQLLAGLLKSVLGKRPMIKLP